MLNSSIDFDGICKLVFKCEYKFTDFINCTLISNDAALGSLKLLHDYLLNAAYKISKEIEYYEKKNKTE